MELIVAQLVNKIRDIYESKISLTESQKPIQSKFSYNTLLLSLQGILILFPRLRHDIPSDLFPLSRQTIKVCGFSSVLHVLHVALISS